MRVFPCKQYLGFAEDAAGVVEHSWEQHSPSQNPYGSIVRPRVSVGKTEG